MENKDSKSTIKSIFFIAVLLGLCLSQADAQEKKTVKEATVITSQTLTTDSKAKTALFEGAVVAKKGDMTLFADRMLVYYTEEKSSSNIKKIDAEGNVKVVKGEKVITAAAATYLTEPQEKLVFTGSPRASEGENVVTGTKMTYFLKDDHSVVENSKVILVNKKQE